MKSKQTGFTLMEVFILIVTIMLVLGVIPWVVNIYKLTQCDFEPPYKAEILRTVGIPLEPMGAVLGFVTFDEEEE